MNIICGKCVILSTTWIDSCHSKFNMDCSSEVRHIIDMHNKNNHSNTFRFPTGHDRTVSSRSWPYGLRTVMTVRSPVNIWPYGLRMNSVRLTVRFTYGFRTVRYQLDNYRWWPYGRDRTVSGRYPAGFDRTVKTGGIPYLTVRNTYGRSAGYSSWNYQNFIVKKAQKRV